MDLEGALVGVDLERGDEVRVARAFGVGVQETVWFGGLGVVHDRGAVGGESVRVGRRGRVDRGVDDVGLELGGFERGESGFFE